MNITKNINEGRGVFELNKEETKNLFNIFKNKGYSVFDYQILNRIIQIEFLEGDYDSAFYKKSGKYYIKITSPKNVNYLKLKSIITHELNHFIEISKIEDKKYRYPNYNKIKNSLLEFNPKNKQLKFFKHIVYKILDNEINANIDQTYTYLISFNSFDEQYLKIKLEEYELRKEYKDLLDFNVSKFKNDIKINKIDFKEFNEILIKNKVNDFLDFINEKNTDKYIDCWFKIIKSNIKKLLKKQDNIIKEVIEDFNNYSTEYKIDEKSIINYTEYLKENLKN
jgi:gas vesicle protein